MVVTYHTDLLGEWATPGDAQSLFLTGSTMWDVGDRRQAGYVQ